jgi:hypothetical protein
MFTLLRRTALTGLALAASLGVSQAATFLSGSYTNNFDTGGSTTNFSGSGSVAGWIYWYGQNPNLPTGYNNTPMTNEIDQDFVGNTNSGSLQVVSYLSGGNQAVFFAGFDNQYGYDDSELANMLLYSNITFYIKMADGTPPRVNNGTNVDFGTIGVGFSPPGSTGWAYVEMGRPTIPLAASNTFVKLSVPINYSLANVNQAAAIAFQMNSYSGYPQFTVTNFIDDLQLNINPGPPPPPPTLGQLTTPTPGLNTISTQAGGQFPRNELMSAASTGLGFVDKPSVTYSWTITSFPTNTGGAFQAGMFIIGGSPGQYDQAADYNLANVFWVTIQESDILATNVVGGVTNITYVGPGPCFFDLRLKTNEPAGNGMIFNTTPFSIVTNADSSLTTNNPHMWPIQPLATLTTVADSALGTWSVTVAGTNVTLLAPDGSSLATNLTADQVALFGDPVTVILHSQPNTTSAFGQAVVFSDFKITGNDTPLEDNFLTDSALNTTIWRPISTPTTSDSNAVILVPPGSAYWLTETLPDVGFSLRASGTLGSSEVWSQPNLPSIRYNGKDHFLIASSNLPSATSGYFQAIEYQASQLQVLLGGQVNAPGTLTGYTGTATNVSVSNDSGVVNVTINAVDPTFHIVSGISDSITFSSTSDPGDTTFPSPPTLLVNGTLTTAVVIQETGSFTITVTDQEVPPLASGTSTSVTLTP